MSAKQAVLGLVIERPGYGYDLAQRLRERFGSSGFAPTGVYSALDQLVAEGLIASAGCLADGSAERAAPRTVYEATPAGVEQFNRWMRAPSPPANVRDELNMKLALSRPRDLPALVELACAQERECLQRLEALKHPPARTASADPPRKGLSWVEVTALLVRDSEIRQLQARIEWLQRVRTIMAKLAPAAHSRNGVAARGGASAGAAAVGGGSSESVLAQSQRGVDRAESDGAARAARAA